MRLKAHKKECNTEWGWSHCDVCKKCGSFNAGNFKEDGLFGFIGFEIDDFNELNLGHLNNDSIRCEQCLKLETQQENEK